MQILFTSEELEWSGENLVWAFVGWQYGVFVCLALFAVFVPDVPNVVNIQLGRQRFIISKVIDQVCLHSRPSEGVFWGSVVFFCECVCVCVVSVLGRSECTSLTEYVRNLLYIALKPI